MEQTDDVMFSDRPSEQLSMTRDQIEWKRKMNVQLLKFYTFSLEAMKKQPKKRDGN